MRKITKIILHCSASNKPYHDDISVIKQWHLARGFLDVGYHFFVRKDGEIQIGRPEEVQGAHCKGHNKDSLGICLHGLNKEDFTEAQYQETAQLIMHLVEDHPIKDIDAHRVFDTNKTCPVFSMVEIFKRMI